MARLLLLFFFLIHPLSFCDDDAIVSVGDRYKQGSKSFVVVALLGGGGDGTVVKVQVEGSSPPRFWAFKIYRSLPEKKRDLPAGLQRYLRRVANLGRPKGTAKIDVVRVTDSQGFPLMVGVMRVANGTILDLIPQTMLSADTSRREVSKRLKRLKTVGNQIMTPVRGMKKLKLSHVDIKPPNYLIPDSPEKVFNGEAPIELADMDQAKPYQSLPSSTGTLGFIAPEMVGDSDGLGSYRVQPKVTPTTDTYSAGMTLYKMIFSETPTIEYFLAEGRSLYEARIASWQVSIRSPNSLDQFIVDRFAQLAKDLNLRGEDLKTLQELQKRVLAAIDANPKNRNTRGEIKRTIPKATVKPHSKVRRWLNQFKNFCVNGFSQLRKRIRPKPPIVDIPTQ